MIMHIGMTWNGFQRRIAGLYIITKAYGWKEMSTMYAAMTRVISNS